MWNKRLKSLNVRLWNLVYWKKWDYVKLLRNHQLNELGRKKKQSKTGEKSVLPWNWSQNEKDIGKTFCEPDKFFLKMRKGHKKCPFFVFRSKNLDVPVEEFTALIQEILSRWEFLGFRVFTLPIFNSSLNWIFC